jgi:hypothetical protein
MCKILVYRFSPTQFRAVALSTANRLAAPMAVAYGATAETAEQLLLAKLA